MILFLLLRYCILTTSLSFEINSLESFSDDEEERFSDGEDRAAQQEANQTTQAIDDIPQVVHKHLLLDLKRSGEKCIKSKNK